MKPETLAKWAEAMATLDAFVEEFVSDEREWTEEGDSVLLKIDYHGSEIVLTLIGEQVCVTVPGVLMFPCTQDLLAVAYYIGRAASK
jgi:hypothetical protein